MQEDKVVVDQNTNFIPPVYPVDKPTIEKPKKVISTFVGTVIIVIVAVVLFGGVFAWQYLATRAQQNGEIFASRQKNDQTQTAGWVKYTNSQEGFEIKFPLSLCAAHEEPRQEGYYFYERTNVLTIACLSPELAEWPVTGRISIYSNNESQNIQNCFYGVQLDNKSTTNKNINGYNFAYIGFQDAAMGGARAINGKYALIKDKRCFNIDSIVTYRDLSFIEGASSQTFTDQEKNDNAKEIQNRSKLLDQIISTFRFTK